MLELFLLSISFTSKNRFDSPQHFQRSFVMRHTDLHYLRQIRISFQNVLQKLLYVTNIVIAIPI